MTAVPFWIEATVAALLVASGLLVLASAIGFVRLQAFFLRMHPVALAYTLGNWCTCIAAAIYLSALARSPMLHPLLIPLLLSVTVPVSTVLLARVSLHRARVARKADVPAALGHAPAATPDAAPE